MMPRKCQKILSRVHAFLDHELPRHRRQEMEEHFHACRECSAQLERFRKVEQALGGLAAPPVPETLAVRILAEASRRAAERAGRESKWAAGWRPQQWLAGLSFPVRLAASAMIPLVFLLGVTMSRGVFLAVSRQAGMQSLEGIEWFDPMPPDSLGAAYRDLSLTMDPGVAPR